MNVLARREHSALELRIKLQIKGCDEHLVSATVAKLVEDGLVSDDRFAEGIARYRRNRGFGPVRIALELKEKGVHETIIEQWVDNRHRQWFETAVRVRQKKFGSSYPDSYDERARQARFLQYRGFNLDQIDHALSKIK